MITIGALSVKIVLNGRRHVKWMIQLAVQRLHDIRMVDRGNNLSEHNH